MKRIFILLIATLSLIATAQERCGTEAQTLSMIANNP